MLSLPYPPHSADDTYDECTKGVQDRAKRARFVGDAQCVTDADTRYAKAGNRGVIHTLPGVDFQMENVPPADMTWLYKNRLAGSTAPARHIYNILKQMDRLGRCALCGVRDATTLDHHLPKSTYPSLAVNPLNLVPACGQCNLLKSDRVGGTHAYFDDVSTGVWLTAELVESRPCVVRFRVTRPSRWSVNLHARACDHFTMFRLGELYSGQAGRSIRGNALAFRSAFTAGGANGVRAHVQEQAASWAGFDPNCWEAAMYTALSKSNWFCGGGFELN